jgi:hypothetical protein
MYRDGLDNLRRKFEAYGDLVILPNERLLRILRGAPGDGARRKPRRDR